MWCGQVSGTLITAAPCAAVLGALAAAAPSPATCAGACTSPATHAVLEQRWHIPIRMIEAIVAMHLMRHSISKNIKLSTEKPYLIVSANFQSLNFKQNAGKTPTASAIFLQYAKKTMQEFWGRFIINFPAASPLLTNKRISVKII